MSYALLQNYFNPSNPITTIQYRLPEISRMFLAMYNTLGQELTVLVRDEHQAGSFEVRSDESRWATG